MRPYPLRPRPRSAIVEPGRGQGLDAAFPSILCRPPTRMTSYRRRRSRRYSFAGLTTVGILTPVIGTMPEGLHPGVIFYPYTRCGNLCLSKTVTLNFLDSHPREGIKPHYGLYQNPPIGVEVVPLLLKPTRHFSFIPVRDKSLHCCWGLWSCG